VTRQLLAAGVTSWRTTPHGVAQCLTCGVGAADDGRGDDLDPNRAWAIRHARDNPGHNVALEVTHSRHYESSRP
jgi:hypothetical protein